MSGKYPSGRSLFSAYSFDCSLEMQLAKPTCRRRSVQLCLSLLWSSTNSCILALPQEETGLCLHIWLFVVLTKGSFVGEKHLLKSKFATYILNPDHAVMWHSPGLLTRSSSLFAPCRKAQLKCPAPIKSLDFYFLSFLYFPFQQNVKTGI